MSKGSKRTTETTRSCGQYPVELVLVRVKMIYLLHPVHRLVPEESLAPDLGLL